MARWLIALGLLLLLFLAATAVVERGNRLLTPNVARPATATAAAPRTAIGTARVQAPLQVVAPRSRPGRVVTNTSAGGATARTPVAPEAPTPRSALVAPGESQGSAEADAPLPATNPNVRDEAEADKMFSEGAGSETVVRLAPFRLPSERGSVIIMRVPVPQALLQDSSGAGIVAFRIASGSDARAIGRTRGLVAPGTAVVRATLSVRRASAAGRNAAASVEFVDKRGRRFLVPVELDVAAERRVNLALDDDYISGARGTWTGVGFLVQNDGNAPESLSLHAELPQGWRSVTDGMPLHGTIAAGASVRGLLRIWIPSQFAAGQARVRILLRSGAVVMAMREVHVSVDDAHGRVRAGPTAELSVAAASGADGSHAAGYSMTLDGAIADSVWLSARATMSNTGTGAASYGLARAGVAIGPPSLSLRAPRFGLSAGAIGIQRPELSGYFLSGLGASTDATFGETTVAGFASRPFGYSRQSAFAAGDGAMAGLSISHRSRALGETSLQGVSLSDAVGSRELKALTLSSRVAGVGGGVVTTEAGYRVHADGAGVGASLGFHRAVGGSLFDVRATHAPGGSQAFARAADDLSLMLSQRVGRALLVSAGAWKQHDRNVALGEFSSDGWFVAPSVNVNMLSSTIGLELRGNSFEAATQAGRFANDEQQISGVLDSRRGPTYLSVRGGVARLGRAIDVAGASVPDATGTRVDVRTALGVNSAEGQFEAVYMAQQFRGEARLYPHQQSISARANGVRLPLLPTAGVVFNADVQRLVTGSFTDANWSARGGASASLPARLGTVWLQAEYNPYLLTGPGGRAGLLYTMRLSRGLSLPRITSARAQRVFFDADGNGARGGNELGAMGVALRCGSLVVVTDADGRFACPAGSRVTLDARTLPVGVLAPAEGSGAVRADADIALRPLAVRMVRLFVAADDSLQFRSRELDAVVLVARDSAGTSWVARSVGQGLFSFDALPPGRYVLDIDASAVLEPLRAPATPTILLVRPSKSSPVIDIELHTRTVRVKQIGSRTIPNRNTPVRSAEGTTGTPAVTQEPPTRQRQR